MATVSLQQTSDKPALHVFIMKMKLNSTLYDVGILDSSYLLTTFKFSFKRHVLDLRSVSALRKSLKPLVLDALTNVVFSDTICNDDPVKVYILIAKLYTKSNVKTVSFLHAFARIAHFHTSLKSIGKQISLHDLNKVYYRISKTESCPWISDNDIGLANMTRDAAKVLKALRLCLYYMCIKLYFMSKNKLSARR